MMDNFVDGKLKEPVMVNTFLTIFSFLMYWSLPAQDSALYFTTEGRVQFVSLAPLEIFEAKSEKLEGVLDAGKNTFAFEVAINSIHGFNSIVQQEHFNENYMESERYPTAFFTGKIIEDIDLEKNGEYTIRAKGKLNLHGIARERIIKGCIKVKDGKIKVSARFTVLLREHNLDVPKIVHQKIAEEIAISVDAELIKQKM